MNKIKVDSDLEIHYQGPDVKEGLLPALFYFALSAEESLHQDPFDQPVKFLAKYPMRVFSISLPGHGPNLDPTKALLMWAENIYEGKNIIAEFVQKVQRAVAYLIDKKIITPEKTALAGLSRGAFIAALVAAKIPELKIVLGFAPLTKLNFAKEFHEMQDNPIVNSLSLHHFVDELADVTLRFYIGNHDTLVGTDLCFQFIQSLADAAFEKRIRTSPIELIIGPSIGFKGHGTSKEVFHDGARWIAEQLEVQNE
jgi:predicted esterase